jgi:hypothetical protein
MRGLQMSSDYQSANKALEPTRVGRSSSAVADDTSCPRVAQLSR